MILTKNRDLIEKADLGLGDLSSGGLLTTEQAAAFVRTLIDEPTLLAQARTVIMGSPVQEINKIKFGSRILHPKGTTAEIANLPSRYLASTDRSKVDLAKVTLQTVEIQAEIRLNDETLEDNIEGQSLQDTVMELIIERSAVDLEEMSISGDETLGVADPLLDLKDGFLVQATSHTVDNLNQPFSKTTVRDALKDMPRQYKRQLAALRLYYSHNNDTNLRHDLSDRATGAGDAFLVNDNPIRLFGVALERVALMPDNTALMFNPRNMIFGVHRAIRVETERNIRSTEWVIVLTARVEFKYEEEDATVKITNIAQPA